MRLVLSDHVTAMKFPNDYRRSETHVVDLTGTDVLAGVRHRNGRYEIGMPNKESLRLSVPVVSRYVGPKRINQMNSIRMQYKTIQWFSVKSN